MAKVEKIDKNGNTAIIKFISNNCGVCTDEHKKIYENCENCYFLKTFLKSMTNKS
jgi:hypothetical protein